MTILRNSLLLFAFIPTVSWASCTSYADSGFLISHLDEIRERLGADVRTDDNSQTSFSEFWFRGPDDDGVVSRDPVFHLMMGFEAVRLNQPVRALVSLEYANDILSDTTLCEKGAIEYFEKVGRREALNLVLREHSYQENDIPGSVFRNATLGAIHPNLWLWQDDFRTNVCVLSKWGSQYEYTFDVALKDICENDG